MLSQLSQKITTAKHMNILSKVLIILGVIEDSALEWFVIKLFKANRST